MGYFKVAILFFGLMVSASHSWASRLMNAPHALAEITVSTGIATATTTPLLFDNEIEDTMSVHAAGVDRSSFTVPSDGRYLCICAVQWENNSTGLRRVQVFINGTAEDSDRGAASPNGTTEKKSVLVRTLTAGDIMTCAAPPVGLTDAGVDP